MQLVKSKHVRMTKAGWIGVLVLTNNRIHTSGSEHCYSSAYSWCIQESKILSGEYIMVNGKMIVSGRVVG